MDEPMCELCGENPATMKMQDAAACDDCFANDCRDALRPILGKRCCTLYRQRGTNEPAICLAVYGVEHEHN